MDWEQFQLWHNYVLNTEYKDNLIDRVIGEFSRVLTDQKNRFSNFDQNKEDLTKNDWKIFGSINSILNKIKLKYKIDLQLPRKSCKNSQKFNRKKDVNIGMMYNIPAEQNGVDTSDDYFYVPIHKTRRHIHGVPRDFIETYMINMIDTAQWEKVYFNYYYSNHLKLNCSYYECPEKYCIENVQNEKSQNKIQKYIKCGKKIQLYTKIVELQKYTSVKMYDKILKYYNKKLIDNFRLNFPKKVDI